MTVLGPGWQLVPVLVIRHAGFPFGSLVNDVADDVDAALTDVHELEETALERAGQVKTLLRSHPVLPSGARAVLGQLRPFSTVVTDQLRDRLSSDEFAAVVEYQESVERLDRRWKEFSEQHRGWVDAARVRLADQFRADPLLREVLLLSNDARFTEHAAWLDSFSGQIRTNHDRKMTDLLAMYAQRVTAKNETHSHFGPFTVGRLSDRDGIWWRDTGNPHRTAFLSHWAAERLASVLGQLPALRPHTTPRRRPWAFIDGDTVSLYTMTTDDDSGPSWRFHRREHQTIPAGGAALLALCDGTTALHRVRATWEVTAAAGKDVTEVREKEVREEGFDAVYQALIEGRWLAGGFEVPVGDAFPLANLRSQIPVDGSADSVWAHQILNRMEEALTTFAAASPAERPTILSDAKHAFQQATGASANRGSGQHYADRSIFYEECHSSLDDLRVGPNIVATVTDELALAYDVILAGPRIRLRRESEFITDWISHVFGRDTEIPLPDYYAQYLSYYQQIADRCDIIDAEVTALESDLIAAMVGDQKWHEKEIRISIDAVRQVLQRVPHAGAICNPDILLAARNQAALAAGDYRAVVGECHAFREILTHTSFAPLVVSRAPEILPEVITSYQRLLAADEVLCNVVRTHHDKTCAQIAYPGFDVEIFGRSPKPRSRVIQPSDMYLVCRNGRIQLHAAGVKGRVRLLAPPTGGISVRTDPLSVFTFPRNLQGSVAIPRREHVPRLSYGRVVLARETWRIPARAWQGIAPGGRGLAGSAAEFFAAARLRDRASMPRHVYLKTVEQPKPVLVDFGSPLSVRQARRLTRGTAGVVEITEMLPSPDQLWLQTERGRFTSELRLSLSSSGTGNT